MQLETCTVAIGDLLLDANNYRFHDLEGWNRVAENRFHEARVQANTERLLRDNRSFDLSQLKDSIVGHTENGSNPQSGRGFSPRVALPHVVKPGVQLQHAGAVFSFVAAADVRGTGRTGDSQATGDFHAEARAAESADGIGAGGFLKGPFRGSGAGWRRGRRVADSAGADLFGAGRS